MYSEEENPVTVAVIQEPGVELQQKTAQLQLNSHAICAKEIASFNRLLVHTKGWPLPSAL